ncbi:MAG: DUF2804 family protein [Alphaproteobacteria bacterium]|nr:DUF2804 family protein [Alphaproteobacteria bacterium]
MPRLIDRADARLGRTPETLDLGIDYLTRRPGPDRLIAEDGTYNAGWFESFDGELNLEQSSAFNLALHRWLHLSFDTPERFIVCNIADFVKAGNTALLVADKRTGDFEHKSISNVMPQNSIKVSPNGLRFTDPDTKSFIRVSRDGERFVFSLHVEHLHLSGEARRAVGPTFTHVTRFHRGRGSLQFYGGLELLHGTLVIGQRVYPLPPGSLGAFDRTLGHQRGVQAWNWIAAVGKATHLASGRRADMVVQIARDRDLARPVVISQKYVVWVEGEVYKVPDAVFSYEVTDEETRETGPWRIYTPDQSGDGVDLSFSPRFHRRETRHAYVIDADFHQHYGEVEGEVRVAGERWRLDPVFAVTEESLLEM